MPKVLILTSKTGGGHVSAAEALRDRLVRDFTVDVVDPLPALVQWHYRMISRHALWLWATEYRMANTPFRSLLAHQMVATLCSRTVGEWLLRTRPGLVITTHAFLTYEVAHAMKRIGWHCPLAVQVTDANDVHCSWFTERNVAAVLAPTRETHTQALAAGFAPERVHFTGLPVRSQFEDVDPAGRTETLTGLGLRPDLFTVFLQGGGEGAAKFARTVEILLAVPNLQVILATGTNHALRERFGGTDRLRPLEFTNSIAPFMAAADVVMGKPGGSTLFESIALGKPFLVTTCIPGQEEANLEFIRRHELGWIALRAPEQYDLLQTLAAGPDRLKAMMATVDAYRRRDAQTAKPILPLAKALMSAAQRPGARFASEAVGSV